MSQFDPSAPNNGYQCYNPLLGDGEKRYGAQTGNTTASAVAALNTQISASTAYNIINQNCRGALFYLRATTFGTSASINLTLKVRTAPDPIAGGGAQLVLAAFPPIGANSSAGAAYIIYPVAVSGAASANTVVAPLPRNYQLLVSLSSAATGKKVQFSLSVQHLL
jgi:hypothetical protein